MSIFKKALEYLTGKQKEKELQEQLNNEKQITKEQQNLITTLANENAKLQQPCKNKLVYNANNQYVVVIDCNDDTFEGYISPDKVEKLKTATTEEIIALLTPPKIEEKQEENNVEQEEKQIVSNFLDIFEGVDDFEVVGNSVFFKNIRSVEIPSLIVSRFIQLIEKHRDSVDEQIQTDYLVEDEEYQSLKAFTLKLLLNALPSSRNQLLTFVRNNDITITKHGNLVLYRACYESNESNELVKFVAKEYLKLKAWKKAPRNYFVNKERLGHNSENQLILSEKSYMLVKSDIEHLNKEGQIGNLAELYQKLPEMQKNSKYFYSSHGKKKIVIGDVYKIDDNEVDLNADVCHSGGLHAASVNYDYSGYGNVNLVVLVNPAKTITVPTYDFGKMRVSEMMVVGINPNPVGVHICEDFYTDLDDNYHNYSIEELENALHTKSLEATSVSTAMSEVSLKDVESISNMLKNRIVTF